MTWKYVSAVDRILDLLEGGGKRSGNGWMAKCPAHDDRKASLKIDQGDDRALIHCHAGCSSEAVVAALGLTLADLFDEPRPPAEGEWTPHGPAIAIHDYHDEAGNLLFQVCRTAGKQFPVRRPDAKKKHGWAWSLGDTRRVLYRLPLVCSAIEAGYPIYVTEGEKDADALEAAGVIATCNPGGAGKWRPEHTEALTGAKEIVIVTDKDEAGRRHVEQVAESLEGKVGSVRIVEPKEGKDAADHLEAGHGPEDFVPALSPDDPDNRTTAREPASLSERVVRMPIRTEPDKPPALALEPDILGRFVTDLGRAGTAGEEVTAQAIYLALTSRVLPWGKQTERPVSPIVKGTTSTGKSHAAKSALRFFPPEAYVDLGSISRKFLFYDEEEYSHRVIYIPEWSAVKDDEEIVSMLRRLLSEGRITHGTVEGEGKRKARRIEKEGPTGLLVTTTQGFVDSEMETRCLSLLTDDTRQQTRRIYDVYADLEEEIAPAVDWDAWHELQAWIGEHGENRVVIPYLRALSGLMPDTTTRLRRDYVTLLCMIRAHAILYQAQRDRDVQGRIAATVEGDYEPVQRLIGDLLAAGAEASLPERTRETVEAVARLIEDGGAHPSMKKIEQALGVGRSATYDRVKDALSRGYLVDESGKDQRGYQLALGAELPASGRVFLPAAEAVALAAAKSCPVLSGSASGRANPHDYAEKQELSGRPGRPATPPTLDPREFRDRLRAALPDREVRRLLQAHRPELIGRNDITTPDERREIAALELQLERMHAKRDGSERAA